MSAVITVCLILGTSVFGLTREEQFSSQIGPHDSITFELEHFASDKQLEFDLASIHYKIQLTPSHLHSNTSCHYFGRVLEPVQSGTPSYLSLSLCSNEGIRGHITIPSNNERLIIFPSRFVTDPQYDRKVGKYELTEAHHVYKESWSSHPFPTRDPKEDSSRHLLSRYTNNEVEIYVLVDAAYTKWFLDQYGRSRYISKLTSYTQDVINGASAEYTWWDWGNAGKIKLAMVELEIMGDYTGQYASMAPVGNSPKCGAFQTDWRRVLSSGCKIDGVKFLRKFSAWRKQKGKYGDAYLALSGMDFQKAGWGTQGSICRDNQVGAVVDAKGGPFNEYTLRIKTVAHEIGHNFNMPHYNGIGVMGQPKWRTNPGEFLYAKDKYGDNDVSKSGWSSQSVKALQDYFRNNGGLSCLQNGIRRFSTRNNAFEGEEEEDEDEISMDGDLDCLKDNEYKDAVCVYNYDNAFVHKLTFTLSKDNCFNSKPIYEYFDDNSDVSYHLFWNEYHQYVDSTSVSSEWAISMDEVNPSDISATCRESDLRECLRNKWQVTREGNDTLETEQSPTMIVTDGYCDGYTAAKENDSESQVTVLYVIIGLLAAVLLVVFGCFIYQSHAKKKDISVIVGDESADEAEDVEVVEVEVNLKTTTQ